MSCSIKNVERPAGWADDPMYILKNLRDGAQQMTCSINNKE